MQSDLGLTSMKKMIQCGHEDFSWPGAYLCTVKYVVNLVGKDQVCAR